MKYLTLFLGLVLSFTAGASGPATNTQLSVKNYVTIGKLSAADSKAALDIVSITKGILPPRLTTAQKAAIGSPPEALTLYDSDLHALAYHNGTAWQQMATLAGTETFTNKTLTTPTINGATFTGAIGLGVSASRMLATDTFGNLATSVATAAEGAQLSGVTSALCGISQSCTLTNKTLTSPSITSPSMSGSVGIGTTTAGAVVADGSGILSISTGLPFTGAAGIGTTAGMMYYSDGSKLVGISGTNGQVPISNGSGVVTFGTVSATITSYPPSVQVLTSGTAYNKDYTFVISSGNATAGDTYTNNGVTFTINGTVASATQVVGHGSGPPASSGTLTRTSGTGDATLTFSAFVSPLYLYGECWSGGGGGGGGGTAGAAGGGGAGGNTTFGSNVTATGPAAGSAGHSGGAIGSVTISSPAINMGSSPGGFGGGFTANNSVGIFGTGAMGSTTCGNGGVGIGFANSTGNGAAANSGAGGGAGGHNNVATSLYTGAGGTSGSCARFVIPNPAASYTYALGTGGGGGTASGNGYAGGAGGSGGCRIRAHYQ